MSASSAKQSPCIGFLTAVETDGLGVAGGYLILNAAGRPLEFHCTAPVKASRVQEILYGPTLKPFLLGEQIGQTLIGKSKLRPLVVCTDLAEMLSVRESVDLPLVQILDDGDTRGFLIGKNRVGAADGNLADERVVRESWPAPAEHLDLSEPFTRIREALDEAQRSARQAA